MDKTPNVAIVTRTKDRPIFLERAIKSVTNQTYKDYMHVIVNDGGDKSAVEQIIDKARGQKPKIRLFHRAQASGAPDTILTESIDRIDSKYVVVHDDDDSWHPEFLERTVDKLEAGAAGVLARTDRVYEHFDGKRIKTSKTKQYMPDVVVVSLYRQCIDNQLTPIAFIYSREAYKKAGKYDNTLPVAGDWEFGLRFLKQYDVEYLDPGFALAYYHERTNIQDNSFTNHSHRKVVTLIANKYLRKDLENGTLGLGYIMSKLKYDRDTWHGLAKMLIPGPILRMRRKP